MPRNNIRYFRKDGGFSRWIDDDEARRHVATQAAEQLFDHRFTPPRFLGLRELDMHQPSLGASPAAITSRQSMANVGIWNGVESEKVPGSVFAAIDKILMYPFEGDTLAVRASCLAPA